MQVKVMFARFPHGASEHPDGTDWLVHTVIKAKSDPRISGVFHQRYDDTPITMSRNRCLLEARKAGVDIVCMIDSDMSPDLPVPEARPFWDSSLDWMLNKDNCRKSFGPCLIAAPYCGPPPQENTYVFHWANWESDRPDGAGNRLEMFGREDAASRAGIEEIGALPTGLILIDMRALDSLPRGRWFYYEWEDEFEAQKASTEDVTFTRDVSLAGIPVYVNWDAWAGHWKAKRVGKPLVIPVEVVRESFRKAVLNGRHEDERMIVVKDGVAVNALPQGILRASGAKAIEAQLAKALR